VAESQPREGISRRQLLVRGGAAAAVAGIGGAAIALLDGGGASGDPGSGSWGDLISLGDVAPVHVSVLPSGDLLMSGTSGDDFPDFVVDSAAAASTIEVQDLQAPMRMGQDTLFCSGHALMADGRMLLVGGQRSSPELGLEYGLLFDHRDPSATGWVPIESDILGGPSWYPTVTRLPNGGMLVISGFLDWGESVNRTVQCFDPRRFEQRRSPWRLLATHEQVPDVSPTGADYTQVFLLPHPVQVDGHDRELVMVGASGEVHFFSPSGGFHDASKRFATRPNGRRPASRDSERAGAGASSAILADGRILIVGGGDEDGPGERGLATTAHIYDPRRDAWEAIETGVARTFPVAILLPDGTVAVVNGDGGPPGDPRRPQVIDPETGAVTTGSPWPDDGSRGYHNVAVLVPDGRVLTASGESSGPRESGGPRERTDLRYFSPPYLTAVEEADRPRVVSAGDRLGFGERYRFAVENGPIHRVTLLSPGSMTHSIDMNQRIVVLFEGEAAGEELEVTGPRDAFVAPPGVYMLFALRRVEADSGPQLVPSVGRMIQVA
jgi:galactose oxidase